MDNLDINDRYYDRKYEDMQERLYKLYDEIEIVENNIEEIRARMHNIEQEKLTSNQIYRFLLYFDKLYDKFIDTEKKEFMSCLIKNIEIYETETEDGRFPKSIEFRFPVFLNNKEVTKMSLDNEGIVESLLLWRR